MKKIITISAFLFLGFFNNAKAQNNESIGSLNIIAATTTNNFEAFRFKRGLISQQDAGTALNFAGNNQWLALGRVTQATQTFYGLRIQRTGRGLTMG